MSKQVTHIIFFLMFRQPLVGQGILFVGVFHNHTQAHHTESSGRVIGQPQRPLPDKRKSSQETDNHAPDGIRTRNPMKQAAADGRLRLRGHRDRSG